MVDPTNVNVTVQPPPPVYLMMRRAPLDEPKQEDKIGAWHVIMGIGAVAVTLLAGREFLKKKR